MLAGFDSTGGEPARTPKAALPFSQKFPLPELPEEVTRRQDSDSIIGSPSSGFPADDNHALKRDFFRQSANAFQVAGGDTFGCLNFNGDPVADYKIDLHS